ncbi:hypothetical protein CGMCC3_g14253 [Colletotrichum fructicola]|nr:uncharacterized protein CGMCC3_g14253 [Colletotrichum fructicola]KAE9569605.1 hypothetical protein CGMCC3_g14253 [Colletotrichum fructicola]
MKRRLIFVFLLVLHSKTIFCQGCFFPDTSTDTRGKRCFEPQEGKAAGCCYDDHYCLDNGLCLEPRAFTIYRASCTDRTFRADGCPTVCLKQSEDAHRGVNWCPVEKIWTCEDAGICNKTSISMESPVQIIMNATAMADPNGVSKSVGISTRAVGRRRENNGVSNGCNCEARAASLIVPARETAGVAECWN